MLFTGCSHQTKKSEFTCITALGTLTVNTDQANVTQAQGYLVIETPDNFIKVSKSLCVEVGEK
jgi:hypothetical protein